MWHCLWLCLCFAYGFAYGIPCSFSGGRHPAGLFVLYHIGAVLVNRFRQNFGGICLFPAPGGCPRVGGGDCSGVAGSAGVGGALRGGVLSLSPAYPAFSLLYRPLSPQPPSPAGKGETQSLFRRGLRPRHPCTEPLAALTDPAIQAPCEREPAARCKNGGNAFLWTMPAAKERGDRGRGTSAFEMVLSPGAGIASAAWGASPPSPPPGTTAARSAGNQPGKPPASA